MISNYIFTIYSILFFFSAMISLFVSFLAIQRKQAKAAFELHFLMLATSIWSIISMIESAASIPYLKIFWSKIEYLISPIVPVLYLVFILSFTRKEKYITLRNILLLLIVPIISAILAWTNDTHNLVWTGYSIISNSTNLMLYSHGLWFWLGYTGYGYIIFFISTIILYQFIIKFSRLFRWNALSIFIGGLFPWAASLMYIFEINLIPGLNITPLSIIASGLIMTRVILYNRLLSLAPIARDILVENLEDGIIVLDKNNRIQDINQAAMNFVKISSRNVIGLPIELTDASESPLYGYLLSNKSAIRIRIDINEEAKWFSVFINEIKSKHGSKLIVIRDVTSFIKMENDLAASEEYYKTLWKSIPDMLFVSNKDGVILDIKADVRDLYFRPTFLLGKKYQDILPNTIISLYDNAIKNALATNEIAELNYELKLKSEIRNFHSRVTALSNDKLLCVTRDTTQQSISERSLKESEENFRSFFETIDDVIIIGTTVGEVLFSNQAVENKLGYSFEDLKQIGMMGILPPSMKDEALMCFKEVLEGKQNFCLLPLQRKDGTIMPVETRTWIGTWNNQPCIFRISKDLSKEQEALLKFNKLFDNNPALMYVSKLPENRLIEVNRAFLTILGFSKKEVIGKTVYDLGLFGDIETQLNVQSALLNSIKIDNFEIQIRTKLGVVIPILFSGETIESQGEKLFLAVITDISEQKEAEKSLILAKQVAEMANRAKSEFLANMSHEIRTPMNSILGFSEIMLNSTDDSKHKEFLNTILSSGNTLLSLIDDILDLSKVEAGKLEIKPEYTTIKNTVSEIKQLFELKARQKHIEISLTYDPEMPQTVLIDEIRLRQILLNIIGNAVKFTNEGHVSIEVNLLDKKGETIFFEIGIIDTGIGIPVHDLNRIFDSFSQQSGHDNRMYGGTGLGLSISKRLMELMGGEIVVESKVGRGSRFILYFKNIPYIIESIVHNKTFVWDRNELEFEPGKILIVDDIEHNRYLLKAYLSRYNFELLEAENGEKAIELSKKYCPDLIFMDIRMPVLDGFQATKILKANSETAKIPVIAVTASTLQNEVEQIKYIFDGFLNKPVRKATIISELMKFLSYKLESTNNADYKNEKLGKDETVNNESFVEVDYIVKTRFNEQFASEISEQKLYMLFDNLSDLADRLLEFSVANNILPLKTIVEQLKTNIESFDFEEVQNELSKIENMFTSLVN
jgi:PAS domain S-box-containing protein